MSSPRPLLLALLALALCLPVAAYAAATHVVISEFATRGPTSATDEFVELYNPTSAAISLSGWKLQYKSATGTSWSDRAVLPSSASIPAHGFFLIANQTYIGTVTPDYTSSLWNSGSGMADNGNERIIDGSSVEVDKVGWGTGNDPEGGTGHDAPNHGTSANNNSVERKALSTSTADSLGSGGAHALLGNGQDTNDNLADYVAQTHGRNPQNAGSAIEPALSVAGNGTGNVTAAPASAYADRPLDAVVLTVAQDSAYTLERVAVLAPSDWTWSHTLADVAVAGAGFASATPAFSGDTLIVSGAAVTTTDGGTITLSNFTTPATKGTSYFNTWTAVSGGALTVISQQPKVRVLQLVPIVAIHVNDATGVCAAPYAVGSEATVTGVVTVNYSSTKTDLYLQDDTGAVDIYSADLPPFTIAAGDSLTVTGSILQFRGLTEIQPEAALMVRHATGRPLPEPLVLTCAEVNATFQPDYTEPNESRLIRINGVTYNATASTITDATGTTNIFIPSSYPATPSVFDIIGILKQYKPGTTTTPPYTADYEITPRTSDDIIAHPGPIILTTPYEDHITATSVQLHWTTDVASTSKVRFGVTAALGDSATDATEVTDHALTVPGLQPATVYYYSVGSADVNGENFSPTRVFSTASPPEASEQVNVYFNKSVDATLAFPTAANANQDLPALLITRLNNARRSIDACIYSLSGTPGASISSALIAAKNRGVKVRVICEYDNRSTSAFNNLSSAGIALINDKFDTINNGTGLMHDKFFVVDSRGGAADSIWVWTGSWNPTDPGTYDDYQNAIELQDPALANVYRLEFEEMWGSSDDTPVAANSRFGQRKLDDTPHKFVIGGRAAECYFSPSDGTTSHIVSTINAAQHMVGFELLTITRTDISAALIAKQAAGIPVRGDMDNNTDTGTQYATLVAGGVDVALNTGSGLLHHKYLIVDAGSPSWDAITLTGSHNWSSSAETSNNENTLILHDPVVTNQYLQEFAARYHQFGGGDTLGAGVEQTDGLAASLELSQCSPNPFRGATRISYANPRAQQVELRLYDVQGREVRTLVNQKQSAGHYQVDLRSHGLSSGIYFYRLKAGEQVLQRKLVLLQ
jgi:phosphatidylserine/phosphatidylglycerophosphate/cardiolipin synthase-like enzyme